MYSCVTRRLRRSNAERSNSFLRRLNNSHTNAEVFKFPEVTAMKRLLVLPAIAMFLVAGPGCCLFRDWWNRGAVCGVTAVQTPVTVQAPVDCGCCAPEVSCGIPTGVPTVIGSPTVIPGATLQPSPAVPPATVVPSLPGPAATTPSI